MRYFPIRFELAADDHAQNGVGIFEASFALARLLLAARP
jgi:hypothetical protein